MKEYGKKVWFIPDGEVPSPDKGHLYSHEAIILTNPNKVDAKISFTIYFRDEDSISDVKIVLKAERMIDIHLNNLEEIPIKLPKAKSYLINTYT